MVDVKKSNDGGGVIVENEVRCKWCIGIVSIGLNTFFDEFIYCRNPANLKKSLIYFVMNRLEKSM